MPAAPPLDSTPKGRWLLVALSAALWLLAGALAMRSDPDGSLRGWVGGALFTAGVATLAAALYWTFGQRKAIRAAWLRAHGRPLAAQVSKVGRRGRRSAWRIKAVAQLRGRPVTFRSDILRADPSRRWRVGDTITVFLDPANPRRYWMDVGVDAEGL
ncbi:MAG: DUF3592 domain-containing protein [Rhodanobacteraceae bacterium]|nr:DUF3592 domain-containing protein [Rhodanobacteraceae bacterium]